MTETAAPVIQQPKVDAVDVPSIGWPLPGVEVRIDAGPGKAGELLVRTPSRPVGSWNGTGVDRFDREEWLATGDIVQERSSDSCLLFVGRQKDLIVVEGYPISPLEIEQAITAHPDVAAALVFGVPDAVRGERVIALVEPAPGRRLHLTEVLRELSGRIGKYKMPSEINAVEKLPVLPSGKLGRQRLAADYVSTQGR